MQLTKEISPAYKKMFDSFSEIETLPVNEWKLNHILGYWCKRYKEHYNIEYTFKFNNAPSKSWEIFNIKKIANQISFDPVILKDYIDYFFKNIIIMKKKRITSIAILANTKDVNNYKFTKLITEKTKSIDRSTEIPPNFTSVLIKNNYDYIKTYGDLAFLNIQDKNANIFNELKNEGMDLSILERVR